MLFIESKGNGLLLIGVGGIGQDGGVTFITASDQQPVCGSISAGLRLDRSEA